MSCGLDLRSPRAKPDPMKMWEGQIRETRIKKREIRRGGDRVEEGRLEEESKEGQREQGGERKRERSAEEQRALYLQVSQSQIQYLLRPF